MVRKRILAAGIACAAGVTAVSSSCSRPSGNDVRSVVLIVVDTLRADRLGLYGYPRGTSPALDDWARRGAVFERSFATSPWTLPSFGSIYTGLLPTRHGAGASVPESRTLQGRPVGHMILHDKKYSFAGLDPAVPTLAEMLSTHGHLTAAVVTNPFLHPMFGVARGFQEYDHLNGSDSEARRADEGVDRALAWIARHAEQPFFLLLHLFDPHMDYDPPPPFQGRFTRQYPTPRFSLSVRDTADIRANVGTLTAQDRMFIGAAYDEEVAFVDQQVGRFLTAIDGQGLLRHTLVLLTADHGEELFEHGGFGHGHAMHDELLRIPFLAWGGGVRPARLSIPVSLVDVAPTILDAAGLGRMVPMDGISLWATLTGAEPPPRFLFAESPGTEQEEKSVIQWPFKVITDPKGQPTRLFDLSANPDETIDRGHENPERLEELAKRIREALPPRADRAAPQLSDDLRERLRKLGYLR